jgi:hypothetical protein
MTKFNSCNDYVELLTNVLNNDSNVHGFYVNNITLKNI